MSKFIEKLRYEKTYDVHMLNKELTTLTKISEEGSIYIKTHILEQKLDTSKMEYGILDDYFYIQVILKTFSVEKWKVDIEFFKFSYKITENKLYFNSELDKQIFDFYYIKVFQFLNICTLEY